MKQVLIIFSLLLAGGAGIFVYAAKQRQHANAQPMLVADAKFSPLFDSPAFDLTDQNGQPFSSRDLAGKVWIADFVFTSCAGPCPLMTSKLSAIAKHVDSPDVRFVSFTVDPKRDTPAVLKKYATDLGAIDPRWSFVTGAVEPVRSVARGMNVAAKEEDDQSVTHSTQFLLVNRDGKVCGIYRLSDDDVITRLAADATELSRAQPSK